MDAKMDVSNVLPGEHEALNNAAMWLREHLQIPYNQVIFKEFEEYFNCKIEVEDRNDYFMQPIKAVFATSQDVTAFVLKWN